MRPYIYSFVKNENLFSKMSELHLFPEWGFLNSYFHTTVHCQEPVSVLIG